MYRLRKTVLQKLSRACKFMQAQEYKTSRLLVTQKTTLILMGNDCEININKNTSRIGDGVSRRQEMQL